jgi:uncharacterized damage-inducible protein DinB
MRTLETDFLAFSRDRFLLELSKIRKCLAQVDEEDIWWHPGEGSNSLGNLIQHLCGNIGQWMGGVGGAPRPRDRDSEFIDQPQLSKSELLARLDETIAMAVSVIDSLDPASLNDPLLIQWFQVTCLTAIYTTVRHLGEHMGQISFITKLRRGTAFQPLWVPGPENK